MEIPGVVPEALWLCIAVLWEGSDICIFFGVVSYRWPNYHHDGQCCHSTVTMKINLICMRFSLSMFSRIRDSDFGIMMGIMYALVLHDLLETNNL